MFGKNKIKVLLSVLITAATIAGQSISLEEAAGLAEWEDAGIHNVNIFSGMNLIDIGEKYKNADNYSDIVEKEAAIAGGEPTILFFPAGEYHFKKGIQLGSNIVLKGEGSDKTNLIFGMNGAKLSAVTFKGISKQTVKYNADINAGDAFILTESSSLKLKKGDIVKVFQGENEWGKSSSGKKKFVKGQILRVQGVLGKKVIFDSKFRLSYKQKNSDGKELKIMLIRPVRNSGVENLTITRTDAPKSGSHAIIHLDYVENCLVSGVASLKGANNHLFLRNALNCEITGSFFSGTNNTGGGGNGYGVSVGSVATQNLVSDNIFEGLRHSIIFATSANANVVYANASFNKPMGNFDEAAISLHGHYPYMNLFEANYVEYICVDYVWGENGPANVFFRNVVYDDGLFGFMNSKEIEIERGNDNVIVLANIANIENKGNNLIADNESPGSNSASIANQPNSLWSKNRDVKAYHSRINEKLVEIPARTRFRESKKTVERSEPEKTNVRKSNIATE